ncbi:hypothetical protein HNY73_001377 [Argiope bruennichi]|uniref:Uncharacterized protein n=1 Tax=Argiope bruennichi TaxID=94029 RepID=A0A8T0G136_ARGBR|nr:hypothetical protein HNY73_001377 [Argiope bruennichi]
MVTSGPWPLGMVGPQVCLLAWGELAQWFPGPAVTWIGLPSGPGLIRVCSECPFWGRTNFLGFSVRSCHCSWSGTWSSGSICGGLPSGLELVPEDNIGDNGIPPGPTGPFGCCSGWDNKFVYFAVRSSLSARSGSGTSRLNMDWPQALNGRRLFKKPIISKKKTARVEWATKGWTKKKSGKMSFGVMKTNTCSLGRMEYSGSRTLVSIQNCQIPKMKHGMEISWLGDAFLAFALILLAEDSGNQV